MLRQQRPARTRRYAHLGLRKCQERERESFAVRLDMFQASDIGCNSNGASIRQGMLSPERWDVGVSPNRLPRSLRKGLSLKKDSDRAHRCEREDFGFRIPALVLGLSRRGYTQSPFFPKPWDASSTGGAVNQGPGK